MVYLRVKPRVLARVGEPLTLGDVADLLADARYRLADMRVSLPKGVGVWQVNALPLVVQIQEKLPDEVVNVLGDGIGYLHRENRRMPASLDAGGHRPMQALLPLTAALVTCAAAAFAPVALIPYAVGVALGSMVTRTLQSTPKNGKKVVKPRATAPGTKQKQSL